MIKGIGTDILSVEKLRPILEADDLLLDPFIRKTFTGKEIELAMERPLPLYFFATRFAGKEAVFKALNINAEDVRLIDIEILSDEVGRPFVLLKGSAKTAAEKRGISQVLISLSYEDSYAIAFCTAE